MADYVEHLVFVIVISYFSVDHEKDINFPIIGHFSTAYFSGICRVNGYYANVMQNVAVLINSADFRSVINVIDFDLIIFIERNVPISVTGHPYTARAFSGGSVVYYVY